jgi:hypothetical protein
MTTITEMPKRVQQAYERLSSSERLIRTSSDSEEAVARGGGFLYSVDPGGKKFPTGSGKALVEAGIVEPAGDGLLAEVSQTYRRMA